MQNLSKFKLLSVNEAAKYLKVSTKTLRRWEKSQKLPAQHTSGGHRRYSLSTLQEFKKNSKKQFVLTVGKQFDWSSAMGDTRRRTDPMGSRIADESDFLSSSEERYHSFLNLQKTFLKFGLAIFSLAVLAAILILAPGNFSKMGSTISASNILNSFAEKMQPFYIYSQFQNNRKLAKLATQTLKGQNSAVLAESVQALNPKLSINIETGYKENVSLDKNLTVAGDVTITPLGTGVVTASNGLLTIATSIDGTLITTNSLDFSNLADALTLDADTTIAASGTSDTITFNTGTTLVIAGTLSATGTTTLAGTTISTATISTATISTADITTLKLGGTAVSSTAAELNYLYGTTVTAGGVLFGDGTKFTQDATNFFWDNSNDRLGIGDASPIASLIVGSDAGAANASGAGSAYIENDLEVGGTLYANVSGTITPGFTEGSVVFADSTGNLAEDNTNFFWDDTNNRLGIGSATPDHELEIAGGTTSSTSSRFLYVGGTLDASIGSGAVTGVQFNFDTSGSSSTARPLGLSVNLNAGYTGSTFTKAANFINLTASTNNFTNVTVSGNMGAYGESTGVGTDNIGLYGNAANGTDQNIGVYGRATVSDSSTTHVGVLGAGQGATTNNIGGYFLLNGASQNNLNTSAALIADNGITASPIFLARDNGSEVFSIINGGNVGIGTPTPAAQLDILGTNSGTTPSLKATSGYIDIPAGTQLRNDIIANDLIMHLPFNYSTDTSRGITAAYSRSDSSANATYYDENNLITSISNSIIRAEKTYISRGVRIEDPRRNLLINSSFEPIGSPAVPPTDWTNSGLSTADANTTYRKHNSYSWRLIAGGSAGQLYRATSANLTLSGNYPFTAYIYNGTSGSVGGTVDATVASLYSSEAAITTTYTNLGGGWWLMRANLTGAGTAPNVGIQVEAGKTVHVDSLEVESTITNGSVNYPTSYLYTTTTTANSRGTETLSYTAYYNYGNQHLTQDQGTYSFWFTPDFSTSELSSGDKVYFMETGTTACQDSAASNCLIKIYMDGSDDKIYTAIYNSLDYTTIAVSSAALSFNANTDHFVAVRWNSSTGTITLNVDGVETTTTSSSWTPPNFSTSHNIYIGSPALSSNTGNRANSVISDVASFSHALNADEVAQIYNSKAPIYDFERKDQVMLSQSTSNYQQIGNIRINGTVSSGAISTGTVSVSVLSSGSTIAGTYTGLSPARGLIEDLAALYPFNWTLTNSKGDGGTFNRDDLASGSASYQREPDLELATVNVDVPRYDRGTIPAVYTSKGPGNPGIWMEASRKNVALYSSFEAGDPPTGWTAEAGITPSANTDYQMHGNTSAKLVNGATAQRYYQTIDFTGATVQHQISAYVYLGTSGLVGNAVSSTYASLYAGTNLTGGALSTTYTSVGKGWYKLTGTFTATAATWYVGIYLPASQSQTVYVDSFQVERTGADTATYYPTTYIPTTTTDVTRAAETLSYGAPSGLMADRGGVSVWFMPHWSRNISGDSGNKYIFEITNYARLYLDATNDRLNFDIWDGATWTTILNTTTNAINQYRWNHFAASWNSTSAGSAGRINNSGLTTDTTSWTPQSPASSTLYIGSDSSGTNQADALISELAFFNRAIDTSETSQIYNNNSALWDLYSTVAPVLQSSASSIQLSQTGDLNISGRFLGGTGSQTLPALTFGSDVNTGIFSPTADTLSFTTNGSEKVTIDTNGLVGIGAPSPANKLDVETDVSADYVGFFFNDGNNADRYGIKVQGGADDGTTGLTYYLTALDGDGGPVGYIQNNAGTFELAQESDVRLKTNIENTSLSGLDTINALRVVDYNWKSNPSGIIQHGFIAQEVQDIFPDMVSQGQDGMLALAQSKLIPILAKATQELNTKVDEQGNLITENQTTTESGFTNYAAKIANLESQVTNLIASLDPAIQSQNISLPDNLNLNSISATNITAIGTTTLAETTVTGILSIGTIQINPVDQSIDAVGILKLQPLALGNIEAMGGLIQIDTKGNLMAQEITANKYKVAGASAGSGILPTGENEIFIETNQVTENSLIFVTASTPTHYPITVGNKVVYNETSIETPGFWIKIVEAENKDIQFNWFIIDKETNLQQN